MSNEDVIKAIADLGISLRAEIKDNFASVSTNILETEQRLNTSIAASEKRITEKMNEDFKKVNSRCDDLDNRVQNLETQSSSKSSQMALLEIKVNQHNLLVFNFKDNEQDEEELWECIIIFITKSLKIPVSRNDFEVVHRMGKKQEKKDRPVFLTFRSMKLRNDVFKAKNLLKGTNVVISEDLPKEINLKRKELYPALLAAKKLNKKAFIKVDKLIVDGRVCLEKDIAELLQPVESGTKKRTLQSPETESKPQKTKILKPGDRLKSRERSSSVGRSNASSSSQPTLDFLKKPLTVIGPNVGTFDIRHGQ